MGFHLGIILLMMISMFTASTPTPISTKTPFQDFPIAKPNCVDRCGNIRVPFPFGMTEDCYLSRSFWLTCNQTLEPPRLFWQNTSTEITDVSFDGQIKVLQDIAHDCHARNGDVSSIYHPHIRLPRQLTVNNTANKLTVVGCDAVGFISVRNHSPNYRLGCVSTCDTKEDLVQGSCVGLGCCQQTTIPQDVREMTIELWSLTNYSSTWDLNHCGYAFLAEETAFHFSLESLTNLKNVTQAPMVADWAIGNGTCEEAKMNSSAYACKSQNSLCYKPNINSDGYRCRCHDGYQGNPYLDDGCQIDIDECKSASNPCTFTCVNTYGAYECICPKGHYGDGRKDGSGCIRLPPSKMINVSIGLGVGIGALVLLSICFCLLKLFRKRAKKKRKEKFFKRNGGFLLQQRTNEGTLGKTKLFPANELEKATDNFNESRILGQGGQGTVYKGMLSNGQIVAIKKSKQVDENQLEQFINEVVILSQINHRNVVKLLGCCLETEVPLLIYELVPNGTLFDLIHDRNTEFPISWNMRLKIAADIAGALAYLHSATSLPIYHRDIKTSNILLDEKYVVKVSDFGTSKSVAVDQTHVTTLVKGTFGYLDPEYFHSSKFTEKSDVYSFGVVLVELLTGQKPVSRTEERGLAARFIASMEMDGLDEILDDQVFGVERKEEVVAVARLARRCLNLHGKMRPTMKEVATELENVRMSKMPAPLFVEDWISGR